MRENKKMKKFKTSIRIFVVISVMGIMSPMAVLAEEGKLKAENVNASFYSETPAENIEAFNDNGDAVLEVKTGSLMFVIPVKDFEFEKSLMQKHFNKNYLESDKFPEATFEGKILDWNGLPSAKKEYRIEGTLNIHGVSQEINEMASLDPSEDGLKGQSTFKILLVDYKVKVPKLVVKKIAEEIEITIEADFQK
jgi:polyisoprenoid-binding protein YceI